MAGPAAWSFYNRAKHAISGTINLGSTAVVLHLVTSASNFATKTISTYGSLTSEVASGNGYKHSGKSLGTMVWTTGASAAQQKFSSAAVVQTATGGSISNVKAAVLIATTGTSTKATANKLLCYASLTSAQFSISSSNTLTITPNASGIFTLA